MEKVFCISRHDLKIRAINYHIQRREETHICISFINHKIYKELIMLKHYIFHKKERPKKQTGTLKNNCTYI
jgi:hypothetical protein